MEVWGSLALILAAVLALAVLTEHFFIPSLDTISSRLKLSDEVAGASLMAIGSSAPELSIALIALFAGDGGHSEVGIGTIVGSAVFNVLVITGLSAVVARGLHVHVFAVRRDIFCYLAAIAYLGLVFVDGYVTLAEALLGLLGYAGYILVLVAMRGAGGPEKAAAAPPAAAKPQPKFVGWRQLESLLVKGLGYIIGPPQQNFMRAFAVSVLLIIGLSYMLVNATITFSLGIGIPPVIVALTLLAAGTSAPDLMASVEVAREGRGGMAVANAVGSNTFDLLVGLALPWTVAMLAQGTAGVRVGTENLWVSSGILVATALVLFLFLETERGLGRREGVILLLFYVAFVLYTIARGGGA